MKFEVTRTDTYSISFEAENKEEAKKMLKEDDGLLNDGSFCGSDFGELECDEEEEEAKDYEDMTKEELETKKNELEERIEEVGEDLDDGKRQLMEIEEALDNKEKKMGVKK